MKFPRKIKRMLGGCIAYYTNGQGGSPVRLMDQSRGLLWFEGNHWNANRLSYHLNVEEIPKSPTNLKEGFVLHTCDHIWCINPDHLYLGTQKQNVIDLYSRHKTIKEQRKIKATGRKYSDQAKINMRTARLNFLKNKRKAS